MKSVIETVKTELDELLHSRESMQNELKRHKRYVSDYEERLMALDEIIKEHEEFIRNHGLDEN